MVKFRFYVKFTHVPDCIFYCYFMPIKLWIERKFLFGLSIVGIHIFYLKNEENVERSDKEFHRFYLRHKSCLKLTFGKVKRVDAGCCWDLCHRGLGSMRKRMRYQQKNIEPYLNFLMKEMMTRGRFITSVSAWHKVHTLGTYATDAGKLNTFIVSECQIIFKTKFSRSRCDNKTFLRNYISKNIFKNKRVSSSYKHICRRKRKTYNWL